MTVLENLKLSREQVATQIATITASPKPSYSIDGQSVSWADYLATLTAQFENLNRLIIQMEPYILVSQAV